MLFSRTTKSILPAALIAVLTMLIALPQALLGSEVSEETLQLIASTGGVDEYPDADAVVIRDITTTEFNEDGSGVMRRYELSKILTDAGIDKFAEEHLAYFKVYDTVLVEIARVIKSDGRVVDVSADDIKDISATMVQHMNIYEPDARDKVISFKNLEVGDCMELLYADSIFHAPIPDEFEGGGIFQHTLPIIKKTFTVKGPKSKPLKHLVKNGEIDFKTWEEGDRIVYEWSAENVPNIITEPAMPPLPEVVPFLIFTTIESWEDLSRWWNSIAETKYAMSDELKAEVASLVEGKTTRDEKADAIYHFVAQKIRYMGLGTGKKKGLEPKPVVETYETKYGVCRDVAALMVAMLREADIDCEIVLTSMGIKVHDDIPYLGFNHAIVALVNEDGSYTYADPTIENSIDWLPAVEAEQQVLVCDSKGSSLSDTPYCSPEQNMGHIKAVSHLNESGLFTSEVTLTTVGFYDMALRSSFKQMPSAQLNMVFGYLLQQVYPGAMLTGFSTSDFEDLTKPLEITLSYQIPDYPLEANEFVLVKAPMALGVFELISRSVFASASLPERQFPWNLGFTFGATEEETITLPEGFKLKAVPDAVNKEYGPIEYKMTYSTDLPVDLEEGGTQVTYRKQLLVKSKRMSPDEYKSLKDVLQASSKSARGEIIMVKEQEG